MKVAWNELMRDTHRELDGNARFEQVWCDIPDNDEDYDIGTDQNDVRLECDGDFVDVCTVRTIEQQAVMDGADLVRFVCPHCNEIHESVVLR
jgi:hypothetical protein